MAFTASDWGQGQLLTGLTPSSSLTGFTAVITKDNLPTSALDTGATSCLNGGGDWRFSTDIDGVNQLPCEIVTCVTSATPASTEFIAWIRFPTYASGTREVYAFWNRAGQSQPAVGAAFGRNEVWQDDEAVLHLNTSAYIDSTGNGHDGVASGAPTQTATLNPLGGDWTDFNGSSDRIILGSSSGMLDGAESTISAIFSADANSSNDKGIIGNWSDTNTNDRLQIVRRSSASSNILRGFTVNPPLDAALAGPVITSATAYIAHVSFGAAGGELHVNGSLDASDATAAGTFSDTRSFVVGSYYSNGKFSFDGKIGEVRVRKSQISADFIASEYNNQSDPSTFWTSGTPFVPSGGGTQTLSPTGIATAEAFGTAIVSTGSVTLSPTGIATAEAFGTAIVSLGGIILSPTGIPSDETFGTPNLSTSIVITPDGIASEEAFGTPLVELLVQYITPTGIASATVFGYPVVTGGTAPLFYLVNQGVKYKVDGAILVTIINE